MAGLQPAEPGSIPGGRISFLWFLNDAGEKKAKAKDINSFSQTQHGMSRLLTWLIVIVILAIIIAIVVLVFTGAFGSSSGGGSSPSPTSLHVTSSTSGTVGSLAPRAFTVTQMSNQSLSGQVALVLTCPAIATVCTSTCGSPTGNQCVVPVVGQNAVVMNTNPSQPSINGISFPVTAVNCANQTITLNIGTNTLTTTPIGNGSATVATLTFNA